MEKTMSSITNCYELILFIVNIIFSWQVITFLIFLILSKPIKKILKRVKNIKFNKTEISLTKNINKLSKQSEIIKLKDISKLEKDSLFMKRVYSIAEISPISVIYFAYHEIENTLIREYEFTDDEFISKIVDYHSKLFYDKKLITEQEYELFNDMTNIYNTVLNNKNVALSIKKKMVIKYGKTADKLIDRIEELKEY